MDSRQDYEVRLSQFEGPLDLLLHLVRKAQVDLRDVFMAEITDQYMRYMEQVDEVDLDKACGFLETASLLLLIKSRALLPQVSDAAPEADENPEELLLENLRLYEAYKNASGFLRGKEKDGEQMISRLPMEIERDDDPVLRGDAQTLFKAFLAVIAKREKRAAGTSRPVMRIEADLWNVDSQKKMIRSVLRASRTVRFASFFSDDAPPTEIAVTFSAMLELWNSGEVRVRQTYPFGDIEIEAVDNMWTI